MSAIHDAKQSVRQAERNARPWTIALARMGHAAKGIVYVIIGFLAFRAAFGSGGETTNSQGALHKIAQQPFGGILLFIVGVGLAGYALWRFVQSGLDTDFKGSDFKGIFQRIGYALSGFAYAGLAFSAFKIVLHVRSKSASQQDWTAALMSQPLGQWLVAIVGLIVIGVGLNAFYKSCTAKFCKHLETTKMSRRELAWVSFIGRAGYAARGVVLSVIGWFLVQAARQANPKQSRGLDQALDTLAHRSSGNLILGIVATGLIAYGIYALAETRYRDFHERA
ncbi:MAG TPA: DUF1206 domain-containing protein [Abditibacteriaceae bacterium]|jgi:multisubunit Na+/H+ antiporter MnhC subunit